MCCFCQAIDDLTSYICSNLNNRNKIYQRRSQTQAVARASAYFALPSARDLQYISIWQYIDTLIEYRIVILCSINIEIFKILMVLSGACLVLLNIKFCVFKVGDKHSILVRKVTNYLY